MSSINTDATFCAYCAHKFCHQYDKSSPCATCISTSNFQDAADEASTGVIVLFAVLIAIIGIALMATR